MSTTVNAVYKAFLIIEIFCEPCAVNDV